MRAKKLSPPSCKVRSGGRFFFPKKEGDFWGKFAELSKAWEEMPFEDKLIYIYFFMNTLGIITLLEIFILKK